MMGTWLASFMAWILPLWVDNIKRMIVFLLRKKINELVIIDTSKKKPGETDVYLCRPPRSWDIFEGFHGRS